MSFTMEDFNRQYVKKYFHKLAPEEQKEVLQSLPPEVLQSLPPEKRLAGLSAEQIRRYLEGLDPSDRSVQRKLRRKK
jgi:hypothetical protein